MNIQVSLGGETPVDEPMVITILGCPGRQNLLVEKIKEFAKELNDNKPIRNVSGLKGKPCGCGE